MAQLPPRFADGKPFIAPHRYRIPPLESREDLVLHALCPVAHQRDSETASHTTRMAHCLSHHERWDGRGYTQALAAASIPLSGGIVAVADVFDALPTSRPCKDAWPCGEAMDYIDRHGGFLFDPETVQVLRRSLDVILGVKARFQDKACRAGASVAREHAVPIHAPGSTA